MLSLEHILVVNFRVNIVVVAFISWIVSNTLICKFVGKFEMSFISCFGIFLKNYDFSSEIKFLEHLWNTFAYFHWTNLKFHLKEVKKKKQNVPNNLTRFVSNKWHDLILPVSSTNRNWNVIYFLFENISFEKKSESFEKKSGFCSLPKVMNNLIIEFK